MMDCVWARYFFHTRCVFQITLTPPRLFPQELIRPTRLVTIDIYNSFIEQQPLHINRHVFWITDIKIYAKDNLMFEGAELGGNGGTSYKHLSQIEICR